VASKSGRSSKERAARRSAPPPSSKRNLYLALAGIAAGVVVIAVVVAALAGLFGSSSSPAAVTGESVVHSGNGTYTNVTADRLAEMLKAKDFTLVNVKTPYIGEIDGTDLYIPYDQLAARANELPQAKSAKILVYCRSGVESGEAVKTLLSMGYTNVWNLDGGMNAWQQSGRTLVQKNRT
jgi:rhodanese-related sulfurtransferase